MSRGPDHTAVSNPSIATPGSATDGSLVRRLRSKLEGNVLFDDFSRGRYSTDASIYQIRPLGVAVPRTQADVHAAIAIAHEMGVPVLPRGGGTSQNGQTVNEALVIDISKYLNSLVSLDIEQRIAVVEPGLVLDHLNKYLTPQG